jgi:hypothetical protein
MPCFLPTAAEVEPEQLAALLHRYGRLPAETVLALLPQLRRKHDCLIRLGPLIPAISGRATQAQLP